MSLASAQGRESGAPTENLAGLVERVTFHNEENGFCVLRLKTRGQGAFGAPTSAMSTDGGRPL